MNVGIIFGILLCAIAVFCNYLNLYCTYDRFGDKAKHWMISYFVSWPISIIPVFGLVFEICWLIHNLLHEEYEVKHPLFEEV